MAKRHPGVTCDRGRYYFVKRVPRRFKGLVLGKDGKPVSQVRYALHTDSLTEANAKAKRIEAEILAEWDARAAGNTGEAHARYEAARKLAQARGWSYRPAADLASGDLEELISRLLSLRERDGSLASAEIAAAVGGLVPEAAPTLAQVFEQYRDLTAVERAGFSEAQAERWERNRRHAVETFDAVTKADPAFPDHALPVTEIRREHALAFRKWWADRIAKEGLTIQSAQRQVGYLSRILTGWADLTGTPIDNPFARLRLTQAGQGAKRWPPFSTEWIETRLLAPGALDDLNPEARDVFLMMVNTALIPSEILDAGLDAFHLDAPIPFFRVEAEGRVLKVAHRGRDLPLLGVSLEAARRIVARGGVQRYAHKASGWSATVNKYLKTRGLKETPRHVPYSLRHSIEDRLLDAGVDDRIRADILGHHYARPKYGEGGALRGRLAALEKVALAAPPTASPSDPAAA